MRCAQIRNRRFGSAAPQRRGMTASETRKHPMSKSANPVTLPLALYTPNHFLLKVNDGVATVTLNRPERKNPLTFESYRELTDFFRACAMDDEVKTVVVSGAGGNFSSGGDVFEIIGPLVKMDTKGLTAFTRMTGDLVKAMRACPQPIIAAVDGICAGAGAIVAMASDHAVGCNRRQGRVPVQQGRPCRMRHGRLRDPAPYHRTIAGFGVALYRPLHDRRGGRALGLLQPHRRTRAGAVAGASFWPSRCPRDRLSPIP